MDMERWRAAYCRVFQRGLSLGSRCLVWRKAQRVAGPGAAGRTPALLKGLGVHRPLVVTGPRLMATGVTGAVLNGLEQAGVPYVLWAEATPNPTTDQAEAVAEIFRRERCDSLIAVGGGSALDGAKAAAALLARPGKTLASLAGLLRVRRKIVPFIAVPTTAGSGSETTIAAVVTDEETHHKYAVMDPCLVPQYAVLDPALTVSLPPALTAQTGLDALTHGVEAYLCPTGTTKETRRCAEEAVELIFKNLEQACNNGEDLGAREALLTASYLAGAAFTRSGVGNVHALAHTLGGLYHTPHGLANAVLLPVVLEDYGPKIYPKLAALARAAGVGTADGVEERAKEFLAELRALNARLDIPAGFDFIRGADLPQIAEWADREANPTYPVPVLYDRARFLAVIEKIRLPVC